MSTRGTNPHMSSVHAAVMSRKICTAQSEAELRKISDEHASWLLGNDKDRLRAEYQTRMQQVGHRSKR